jgi:hypothetical protein
MVPNIAVVMKIGHFVYKCCFKILSISCVIPILLTLSSLTKMGVGGSSFRCLLPNYTRVVFRNEIFVSAVTPVGLKIPYFPMRVWVHFSC